MKHFILVCLAIASEFAWANEFHLDEFEEDEFEGDDDTGNILEDIMEGRRALSMSDWGWFTRGSYHAKTREEKMYELWSMLLPDQTIVETPREYFWKEFDEFFKMNANRTFCN